MINKISDPVIKIQDLHVCFSSQAGPVQAVRGVSFEVHKGETYALVGESGCGKSTLALAIMSYPGRNGHITNGEILFHAENLLGKSDKELCNFRGNRIAMVYQDPLSSLNPSIVVGEQIAEVLRIHKGFTRKKAQQKAVQMLNNVQITDAETISYRYPHQLSGGMQQRVCIAMALCTEPDLLIMDEPTTSLDVTTEAVILDLIKELKSKFNTAIIYITHNLGIVAKISDRVGVVYLGRIVEEASVKELFFRPLHPYTISLLNCIPKPGVTKEKVQLESIAGRVIHPTDLPTGCTFSPRCLYAKKECSQSDPDLIERFSNHRSRCVVLEGDLKQKPKALTTVEAKGIKASITCDIEESLLLKVTNIKKYYEDAGITLLSKIFGTKRKQVKAIDGISFTVDKKHILSVVGESGCGKSTLAKCIIGLLTPTDGQIEYEGRDITVPVNKRSRDILRNMQMVFQNPDTTLNPRRTIGGIIVRSLRLHRAYNQIDLRQQAIRLLQAVNLDAGYMDRLPRQLSGGEKQRVAIARAFTGSPKLVICDEATSSLDVSVQASILNLLLELQRTWGTSYLFISHDLNVVRYISDHVAVIYLGKLCEIGRTEEIFSPPYHPYTKALLFAMPIPIPGASQIPIKLRGEVPSSIVTPSGCGFNTRCPEKLGNVCEKEEPPCRSVGHDHKIYCHKPLADLMTTESFLAWEEERTQKSLIPRRASRLRFQF